MRITLASASPRRRELIKKINGIEAEICPSGADERISEGEPRRLAERLAERKARAVFEERGGVVVGADTIVTIDGRVLGKPRSESEAYEFFRLLCGRTHEVITGISVISASVAVTDSETTRVTLKPYDAEVVSAYIATGSPFDKAGGYGIQDEGLSSLIDSVDGELDNVIGLPVRKLAKILEENFLG